MQSQQPAQVAQQSQSRESVPEELVLALQDQSKRETALLDLSKKRDSYPDLAPVLWNSFGVIAILLQEIVSIYHLLNPPQLSASQSNRVCNALALLQCVASHPETRSSFISGSSTCFPLSYSLLGLHLTHPIPNPSFYAHIAANIPFFLYPFLNTMSKQRPFEYLRLTSLGVIGALVKVDDSSVINFLLSTEIIPLCLRTMELGSELSKTVATFIVQKILVDDYGLEYICATDERCNAVGAVLKGMVSGQNNEQQPSHRLLKHIIRCYHRLAENARARECLKRSFPDQLRDPKFTACLDGDEGTKKTLDKVVHDLFAPPAQPETTPPHAPLQQAPPAYQRGRMPPGMEPQPPPPQQQVHRQPPPPPRRQQ